MFVIEADGKKIVHCGDLGHMPSESEIEAIRGADVLLIPTGGFYTIDAQTAEDIRKYTGLITLAIVPVEPQSAQAGKKGGRR